MVSGSEILGRTATRIVDAVGGPARLQIILVLAAILGLDTADRGTVSAVSDQLKGAFKIGNTEIGLLLAVVSYVGAMATLPMGVLADRVHRKTILLATVPLWTVAMIVSGTATSYVYLLVTRLFLGAVTAAAWPCVASLTGDFFPARERAGIYGLILAGELVGTGIGFFISSEVSSFIDWHWSFYAMAVLAILLTWVIWRYLPEPERGSQSWIEEGEEDPNAASRPRAEGAPNGDEPAAEMSSMQKKVLRSDVEPREALILREDPTRHKLLWVIGYLLKIPTYRLLIAMTAFAYYFFAGISIFAMIYFTQHWKLSRGAVGALVFVVGAGAVVGVVSGGRIAERLLHRGKLNARLTVPPVAFFLCVPFFGFGFWTDSPWIGTALVTIGAGILASAVAPIDAARLDIVHPRLWGRSESGRTVLRSAFEGSAPLLFGAVSGWLGGGASGLMWTFLVMLVTLPIAGCLSIPARRAYPRDVATAAASVKATSDGKG